MDITKIVFDKATSDSAGELVKIIHRCIKEVNSKDYILDDINRFLVQINIEKIRYSIVNNHFYVAKYYDEIIGMGAVARESNREKQCYFTSVFIKTEYHKMGIGRIIVEHLEKDEWCLDSEIIEIPASKTALKFYEKLGYKCYTYPPKFKKDGSTIMYKLRN